MDYDEAIWNNRTDESWGRPFRGEKPELSKSADLNTQNTYQLANHKGAETEVTIF